MRQPKIITTLQAYSWSLFVADLLAGATVAMVALPLSLAIAIASGVDPAKGLVTAIVAGFLIFLLGGSRVQIGGPTGLAAIKSCALRFFGWDRFARNHAFIHVGRTS
jgi:SulP family sulfate permease